MPDKKARHPAQKQEHYGGEKLRTKKEKKTSF